MSNKLLAFIILICFFGILVGGYLYFFVFYTSSLEFRGNVQDYSISLTPKKISQELKYTCEEKICVYEKIAPLEYTIKISKEGYSDYRIIQKVPGKGKTLIEFNLIEKTELTQITETTTTKVVDTATEKRTRLKYRNFYLHYDFGEAGVFYVREYLGKLFLYRDRGEDERLVYDFEKVSQDKIHIAPVYSTDYFIVYVDGVNYLFNNKNISFRGIDLRQKIEYGKKGNGSKSLVFVTSVGSYIHNLQSLKSEYYYPFSDFVYLENNEVLGVIKKEDIQRQKNIGITSGQANTVYRYSTKTKKYETVYSSDLDITQMYLEGENLLLMIDGELKQLQNY